MNVMTTTKSRILQAQELAIQQGAVLYNIQVYDGRDWEEIEVKHLAFLTRRAAVDFCYNLSYVTGRKIRLSEGDHRTANGDYIEW